MRLWWFPAAMVLAGASLAATSPVTLREVCDSIASVGARVTLQHLYKNKDQWVGLLAGIATGEPGWLNTAKQLRAVSDAGATEQIDLAAGEALEHRPADVLSLIVDDFGITHVCGGADVDDARFDSYESSMAAIQRREEMLRAVREDTLRQKRDACLAELDRAKADVARFYGH
jgi:hypothetical protein